MVTRFCNGMRDWFLSHEPITPRRLVECGALCGLAIVIAFGYTLAVGSIP